LSWDLQGVTEVAGAIAKQISMVMVVKNGNGNLAWQFSMVMVI